MDTSEPDNVSLQDFISSHEDVENIFQQMEQLLEAVWARYKMALAVQIFSWLLVIFAILALCVNLYSEWLPSSSAYAMVVLGCVLQLFLLLENNYIKRDYQLKFFKIEQDLKNDFCYFMQQPLQGKKWKELYAAGKSPLEEDLKTIQKRYPYVAKLVRGRVYFK